MSLTPMPMPAAGRARARRRVAAVRLGAHVRRIEMRPRVDRAVGRGDARELRVRQCARRERPGGDRAAASPSAQRMESASVMRSRTGRASGARRGPALPRCVAQEQRLQVVQEAPAERGGADQRRIGLEQAARLAPPRARARRATADTRCARRTATPARRRSRRSAFSMNSKPTSSRVTGVLLLQRRAARRRARDTASAACSAPARTMRSANDSFECAPAPMPR